MYREDKRKTLVSELPLSISEEDCKACMRLLPAWRKKKAESFRHATDRMLCAKAYLLLCQLLEEWTGKTVMPDFAYGEHGKPYLPDFPDIHFNMSHCHRAVVCTIGSMEVGCDVEEIPDKLDDDVINFCFSQEEKEAIYHSDNPEVEFTRQWTRKEALLKLHGIGLIDELPSVLKSPLAQDVCFETNICQDAGYIYTICYRTNPKQ